MKISLSKKEKGIYIFNLNLDKINEGFLCNRDSEEICKATETIRINPAGKKSAVIVKSSKGAKHTALSKQDLKNASMD